jgi:hypothetical protein
VSRNLFCTVVLKATPRWWQGCGEGNFIVCKKKIENGEIMKNRKSKSSATVFFSAMLALALALPDMAFALQSGDFTYKVSYEVSGRSTVTITGYNCPYGSAVIPASIDGMPVVGIGNKAFYSCDGLTSVTIPSSVTSIGFGAFQYCSGLTSVTIGNGVTSIGQDVFLYCTSLTNIVVEAGNLVYSSQDGVLYDRTKTVLIQYPGGKSGAFTIPNRVRIIRAFAFRNCDGLTSVIIPQSVMSIMNNTFQDCTGLTSVILGNGVKSIGDSAFTRCTNLTSVTMGNRITSIGNYAFGGCNSMTSITIPSSVTSIGFGAFNGCASLSKVNFLGNATSMEMGYVECFRWGDCIFIRVGVFENCDNNFTICYAAGSTGFTTPTWYGYPAAICEEPETTTTTTIPSWSCAVDFIYGENSEQTELLREYRDKVLSKTPEGQELIKTYYKLSPTVTMLLEQRPLLKDKAKAFIDEMLPGIREMVEENNKCAP